MKNTWKGIRSIISLQKTTNDSPKIISLEDHTFTDREQLQYLRPSNQVSFFISPCTKEEIIEIISNFKPKIIGRTKSIPTKILWLLTDDISKYLSIIFNASFAIGIFPEKLKVAKFIPIHKKDFKLGCSNYRPISLL